MSLGYLFSGKILIFSLIIKIMAIVGALYLFFLVVEYFGWSTTILQAYDHEILSTINLKNEIVSLEQECNEGKKVVARERDKISAIEKKISLWIDKNQKESLSAISEHEKLASEQSARTKAIEQNLESFLQTRAVVKELKEQVAHKLAATIPDIIGQSGSLFCEDDFDDFTTVTSASGKTSFVYAKVFLGFLTKHKLTVPDPQFLLSLSQMFKTNEFFFFAKGGLLNQGHSSSYGQSEEIEKMCVVSCKKTLCVSDMDPKCCLCCYHWHEMVAKIKIDQYLQRLLEIIIARDAQKIISDVLKELAFMVYSSRGELLCEIESTKTLSELELEQICGKIFQLYNLKPVCIFKINPCLMGGVLIRSNRFRIDNSVYGYLNKVFYKLDSVNA